MLTDENLDKTDELIKIAKELGISMSNLALAWILRHPIISSVITGASRLEQIQNNIAASGFVLPNEIVERIEVILKNKPVKRKIG